MRFIILFLAGLISYIAYPQEEFNSLRSSAIIVDHKYVESLTTIPDSLIEKAIKFKLLFRHASVGTTINDGLNCLQGTRTSPSDCTLFPDYKYDRRNWLLDPRLNSGWYGKIDDFVDQVKARSDSFDIFLFKYCYLDGLDGLQEPCGSAFSPTYIKRAWDSLRINMEMLENQYPTKKFIWFTIPLTQTGQHCTDTLNKLIRTYCIQQGKVLFDIADIQCHDSDGNYKINSNGWEMAYKPFCGEQQIGAQSCHPNWLGKLRLCKAFWWMMSNLDQIPTSNINKNIKLNIITLSPNPANTHFKINGPETIKDWHVTITDQLGKIYLNSIIKSNLVDIPFLDPGIYLVQVQDQNQTFSVLKLIKF